MQTVDEELDVTVVVVEQNPSVIPETADRCYATERGEVVDELGPEQSRDESALVDYLAV